MVESHRQIESTKVEINDHIKVLRGLFCGLLERVMGLTGDEVKVHLPSQDFIEHVHHQKCTMDISNCSRYMGPAIMVGTYNRM